MGTLVAVMCHDKQLHIQDSVKWVIEKIMKAKTLVKIIIYKK